MGTPLGKTEKFAENTTVIALEVGLCAYVYFISINIFHNFLGVIEEMQFY